MRAQVLEVREREHVEAAIRAFADAGLPAGVANLVFGMPSEISECLIPHSVIRKVSVTGSTPVGKQLASLAGLHMTRVTMELGGHAPVLVAGDAGLDLAASTIMPHKFRNAGQVCISPIALPRWPGRSVSDTALNPKRRWARLPMTGASRPSNP